MSEKTVNEAETAGGSVTEGLPKGFTYFVRDGDMIKIGSSMRPADRVSNLQTGSSRPLDVLAIVSQGIAPEFETHQLFAHLRVRGEWFRADQELLYFIEGIKAAAAAVPKPEPMPEPLRQQPTEPSKAMQIKAMVRRLSAVRQAHGPNSPMGHAASNLTELLPAMVDYVRPDWATDERQTLPWQIQKQMNRLAALKAAAN